MRILILEDSITMLRVIKRVLNSFGYTDIVEAWNGIKGLAEISKGQVDIILTDRNMAGMDGIAFTKEIRKRNKDIPILMISVEGSGESIMEAMNAGVSDYIVKPFVPRVLKEKIKHFLSSEEKIFSNKSLMQKNENCASMFHSLCLDESIVDSIDLEEVQKIDTIITLGVLGNEQFSELLKNFTETILNDKKIEAELKKQIVEHISFLISQHTLSKKKQKSFIKETVLLSVKKAVPPSEKLVSLWKELESFFVA